MTRFNECQYSSKRRNYKTKYITLHCSATKEGVDIDASSIDAWHRRKGWTGIGYHYVIKLDGTVQVGRPLKKTGAHVKGYNQGNIGICYVGGLSSTMIPKDTRTEAQKDAMLKLLRHLKEVNPNAVIQGHRDFSPDKNNNGIIEPFEWMKLCPCFDAKSEYREL